VARAQEADVVCVVGGMSRELVTFTVFLGEKHVMDIRLRYIGTSPEDIKDANAMAAPDWRKQRVDFYYLERVNLTDYTLRIVRIITDMRLIYVDKEGTVRTDSPKTYTESDLIRLYGKDRMTFKPHEMKIIKDTWINCKPSQGCTNTDTITMMIVETGERFAYQLMMQGNQ
jgi:hypothetical protein